MNIDWMDLLQFLVLLVTTVIVFWYTYETRQIRMDAGRQAAVTPSAKLWDRQNELDRLILLNPSLAMKFMSMANRREHYFTASPLNVPRDELYCQLKAFVYLQLNFFEEIYLTTSSAASVAKQFEREEWEVFIFRYMRHALLREVFETEKNRAYTGDFVTFLESNASRWSVGDADDDLF